MAGATLRRGPEGIDPRLSNPPGSRRSAQKQDYVLWLGVFDHLRCAKRALAIARAARVPIVLAGPVLRGHELYFASEIAPFLVDDRVRYLAGVAGNQQQLLAAARALLLPVRHAGQLYRQLAAAALAVGTPVFAFADSGIADLVEDGVSGRIVQDEQEMVGALADVTASRGSTRR